MQSRLKDRELVGEGFRVGCPELLAMSRVLLGRDGGVRESVQPYTASI